MGESPCKPRHHAEDDGDEDAYHPHEGLTVRGLGDCGSGDLSTARERQVIVTPRVDADLDAEGAEFAFEVTQAATH
jgi:hypothetical protein